MSENRLVFGAYTKGFTTKHNSFKSNFFTSHLFKIDEETSDSCFYTNNLLDPSHATNVLSNPGSYASVFSGDS